MNRLAPVASFPRKSPSFLAQLKSLFQESEQLVWQRFWQNLWQHRADRPLRSIWTQAAVGLGLLPIALSAGSALAADRITISYGLLERSISVHSLETYAQAGEVEPDLHTYTRYLDATQLVQLRQLLLAKTDLSPVAVSQFLYTDQGEILLKRIAEVIRTDSNQAGFYAIRSALILAAADSGGLTPLNVLKEFPLSNIRIDLGRTLQIWSELEQMIRQTQDAVALVEQQSSLEADSGTALNLPSATDLRLPGPFAWQKQSLQLTDASRNRTFPADIYLPQNQAGTALPAAPVIVISHGLGSDRSTYAYLAKQLASYGFAVAVPEHPGSNAQQLQALISGSANQVTPPAEFINRPLDIKYLLNELDRLSQSDPVFLGRLNLQQVGVVGQSLGGYTALALAGAKLNFQQLAADCVASNMLNPSLLLQCRVLELPKSQPDLQDERVKAIIAINPIGSSLFGEADFAEIQIPVMLISGSADTVAPALLEQIRPFTWLTSADKYFVMLQGGTHFSTIDVPAEDGDAIISLPAEVVGPDPRLAQTYVRAMGVAFFETYVENRAAYRSYLGAAYVKQISQPLLPISLVQSLTSAQLAKVFREQPRSVSPQPTANSWTGG